MDVHASPSLSANPSGRNLSPLTRSIARLRAEVNNWSTNVSTSNTPSAHVDRGRYSANPTPASTSKSVPSVSNINISNIVGGNEWGDIATSIDDIGKRLTDLTNVAIDTSDVPRKLQYQSERHAVVKENQWKSPQRNTPSVRRELTFGGRRHPEEIIRSPLRKGRSSRSRSVDSPSRVSAVGDSRDDSVRLSLQRLERKVRAMERFLQVRCGYEGLE